MERDDMMFQSSDWEKILNARIEDTQASRRVLGEIQHAAVLLSAVDAPIEDRLALGLLAQEVLDLSVRFPRLEWEMEIQNIKGVSHFRTVSGLRPATPIYQVHSPEEDETLKARLSVIHDGVRSICECHQVDLDAQPSSLSAEMQQSIDQTVEKREQTLGVLIARAKEISEATTRVAIPSAEGLHKSLENCRVLSDELSKVSTAIHLVLYTGVIPGDHADMTEDAESRSS